MSPNRTLVLRTERLAELAPTDLAAVVGAAGVTSAAPAVCAVSDKFGFDCGSPTCGRGCTGTSSAAK